MNDFLELHYNGGDEQLRDPQPPGAWNPKIRDWIDEDMDEEPDVFVDKARTDLYTQFKKEYTIVAKTSPTLFLLLHESFHLLSLVGIL